MLALRAFSKDQPNKPNRCDNARSTCALDGVSLYPTYRKPFDMIAKRVKTEEWSALEDDFRTFLLGPEALKSQECA